MPIPSAVRKWFDAHLDLACLAECGRDLSRDLISAGGPFQPAGLTWGTMADGSVRACLGTIFTEADGTDEVGYPAADPGAAHARGVAQLRRYERWHEQGVIALVDARPAAAEHNSMRLAARDPGAPLRLALLMECADPIREPGELGWWVERGVSVIGMAWARGSRYAAGNMTPGPGGEPGLSVIGRELVREMDAQGVVHDASHLSDRALDELLDLSDRVIVASHSNCRAFMDPDNQRHLTDRHIRAIVERGGVIGVNLLSSFLRTGLGETGRASMDDLVRHVEHVCTIAGHRRSVGLGSDMDGGFSALRLPESIHSHRDLPRIAEALASRGWSDRDIDAFAWGNWTRVLGLE